MMRWRQGSLSEFDVRLSIIFLIWWDWCDLSFSENVLSKAFGHNTSRSLTVITLLLIRVRFPSKLSVWLWIWWALCCFRKIINDDEAESVLQSCCWFIFRLQHVLECFSKLLLFYRIAARHRFYLFFPSEFAVKYNVVKGLRNKFLPDLFLLKNENAARHWETAHGSLRFVFLWDMMEQAAFFSFFLLLTLKERGKKERLLMELLFICSNVSHLFLRTFHNI